MDQKKERNKCAVLTKIWGYEEIKKLLDMILISWRILLINFFFFLIDKQKKQKYKCCNICWKYTSSLGAVKQAKNKNLSAPHLMGNHSKKTYK